MHPYAAFLCIYQISKQSDNAFAFYGNFHTLIKEGKKEDEEIQPIFEGSYLSNA